MSPKQNLESTLNKKDYKELIDFTPKSISIVQNVEKEEILGKHSKILNLLQKQDCTAKELHELFLNKKLGKYDYSLKTVYEHLRFLEEKGLVIHSGQRMTKGKRTTEKLYRASAKFYLFHRESIPVPISSGVQKPSSDSSALFNIIKIILTTNLNHFDIEDNALSALITKFNVNYWKNKVQILHEIEKNASELEPLLSNQNLGLSLQHMLTSINTLAVLLKNPEVFTALLEIFSQN